MTPRPGHIDDAERFYLRPRSYAFPDSPKDPEEIERNVQSHVSVHTDTCRLAFDRRFGLRWAELLFLAAPPPTENLFKVFVTVSCEGPGGYRGWLSTIEVVTRFAATSRSIRRLKICVSPDWLARPDGIVLFVDGESLPGIVGEIFGMLPSSAAPEQSHLPTFAAPFPDGERRTCLSYVQGEHYKNGTIVNPSWAPKGEIFSARELRAMAYVVTGADEVDYQSPQRRDLMARHGFSGSRFHLTDETSDPIHERPAQCWAGFFRAYKSFQSARDPQKVISLEAALPCSFAEAISTLAQRAESSESGSQRKIVLDLPGSRACFRPQHRRLAERTKLEIEANGLDRTVAPSWRRSMSEWNYPQTLEGFERMYEDKIGDPRLEVAASLVAAALGSALIPASRMGEWAGESGSLQVLVDLASPSPPCPIDARMLERELEEAAFLDYLLAATDRVDNWEITSDGHVLLVDNSQVFGAPGKYGRRKVLTGHKVPRDFYRVCHSLDVDRIARVCGDLLTPDQAKGVVDRARQIIAYVDRLMIDLHTDEIFAS